MTKPTLKELIDAVFAGKTIQYDYLNVLDREWKNFTYSTQAELIFIIVKYYELYQYRIKPAPQVQQYRVFAYTSNKVGVWYTGLALSQKAVETSSNFKQWLSETQEYTYEVEE